MIAEVVAVGTELLLGQIVDTNSSWIGEQLALIGIDCHRQLKVGDNLERIVDALDEAAQRADAIIVCGGLGPTQDDLTRQAIAQFLGVALVEDEDMAERIIAMFESRGRRMPMNNLVQAQRPEGSAFVAQQPGTAPGLVCEGTVRGRDVVVYAVPGVPFEMREMVTGTILPDLARRSGQAATIASRTLKTWGFSESGMAEMLDAYLAELDADPRATIAFLASGIEGLKVRITTKAASEAEAHGSLDAEERRVREVLGEAVFGVDDATMESTVLDQCRTRRLTLATAESVTGGMIASRLCAVAGASDTFRGSVVSYASDVKFAVLGVAPGPVITESAAIEMAEGARRVLGADVAIATTGVAGPDSAEGQPVGTVCIAIAVDDRSHALTTRLPGHRQQIRELATISALDFLRRLLDAED